MQITETHNEGLERELKVVVPKDDLAAKLNERLTEMRGKIRINGFRQGKVPVNHIKKLYGKQVMAEIVNELVSNRTGEVLKGRDEKAAQQPEIAMTEDEKEAEDVLAGNADFEFSIKYEVMPEITLPDLSKIEIERPVAEVSDEEVDKQVMQIAESARTYQEKSGKIEDGDRVTFDYLGKVDGEPFDGGKDDDAQLVIGSGRFIPGFEEQMIGFKAGDEKTIKVTFPEEYGATHLAGKEAEFDVKVKKVEEPDEIEINDDLAKQLGVESAEKLKEAVRSQIESRHGSFTRAKVKRQVLDKLDELTKMELPKRMVAAEFENIWKQMTEELERNNKTFEDEDTTEEETRKEYREIAERRVRLGLVIGTIGDKAGVTVADEELQRGLMEKARQYPGQEKQVFEFYQNNPQALVEIRGPIFEQKVVEHIAETADVSERSVSRETLQHMLEHDHEHGEECDHPDHDNGGEKKAAGKKAPAKKAAKKAAKKDD